jgi:hypothetical protein
MKEGDKWTKVKCYMISCGLGSSVGVATGYGLESPGIKSRWGKIFNPSRPALGPTQPPGYRVFPGGKERSERAADNSPPYSAEVLEE